jgi:hypothetical protein
VTAELEVLQDAVTRLERAGIDYMLTGSIALSYYAQPRMTRDIDLVVELSGREAKSVAALFAPSYYVAEADVGRAITGHGMFNVLHLDKVVKIDFIIRKDTPYRLHEFERRQRVRLPGFEAWIVSRDDLILSKLVWAKDDTTPEFARLVSDRFARMAPEERVRLCTEMFDTAQALAQATMPDDFDPAERRFRLCERFYGGLAHRAFSRRG